MKKKWDQDLSEEFEPIEDQVTIMPNWIAPLLLLPREEEGESNYLLFKELI